MDDRQERMVRNEAVFRRANERLRELGESFSAVAEHASFLCECPDTTCTAQVELTLEEYEEIRSQPGHFFMLHGHDRPEIERVVRETDRYVVTEKPERKLAEAAVADDPRAD